MIRTTRASTRVIPKFKAQGLIASDHDLGGAMRQSPLPQRGLPRLRSSERK